MTHARIALAAIVCAAVIVGACGGGGGATSQSTLQISKVAATDGQTGTVGQTLGQKVQVKVIENGQPQVGTIVSWGTAASGSTVTADPGGTDANGVSSATWTLGTVAGNQSATATLAGASGSPATFTAIANPGAAATLAKPAAGSGDNQGGFTGLQLPSAIKVLATDQFGNPVGNVTVNWTVPSGGATVNPTTGPTDVATGLASTTVTLGPTAMPITIRATSTPVLTGSPLDFSATINTPPTAININMGPGTIFKSGQNNSQNPAVDTLKVNGTATWHAVESGHGPASTGSPGFTGSATAIASPGTFAVQFTVAGTYQYDCVIHGSLMTGRIVVIP